MFIQRLLFWAAFCCLSLSLAAPGFAAPSRPAEAARVIAVTPGAFVQRGNARTPLKLKDPLYKEDQVSTDATGKLQVLFADDTTVAVAPDSMVNIADFSFGGPAKANFALGVGRGLARVVTGKVVERNREGFKVTTPHATVGIRGTILTADVRSPSQSKFILSQLGAGHSVSVFNTATGQHTEMPKAGLTTEAGATGNVLRPATPAEMNTVQTVTRQTRQAPQTPQTAAATGNAAQGNTAAATAQSAPSSEAAVPAMADSGTPAASNGESAAGSDMGGQGGSTLHQAGNDTALRNAVEDVIAGGDLTPGVVDNPGALKASYEGQLHGVSESSGIGGSFSFDVNLGSGGIDNGKMAIGTNAVPNTYSGTNGTGQVTGGIFNVGDFTASPDSLYPNASASMHGGISNDHVDVEHWEVRDPLIPGKEGADKGIFSGTGEGHRVSR